MHSDERNFKCDQCPNAFKTKHILQTHQYTHLVADQRPKLSEAALARRKSYSKSEKKYKVCDICGRSITISGFVGHVRMHTGVKPYPCSHCPKTFSTRSNLRKHNIVHTDERRYKCDICGKTFRSGSNLCEHRVKHSSEKPYKCSYCEKAFYLPFNLRLHERIHTGEKPYGCNLCSEKFSNSGALRRHATVTHPGEESIAVTLKPKQYVAERWR